MGRKSSGGLKKVKRFDSKVCCGDWFSAIQEGTIRCAMEKYYFEKEWRVKGCYVAEWGHTIKFCPFCGRKRNDNTESVWEKKRGK